MDEVADSFGEREIRKKVVYMSPRGKVFDQKKARELSELDELIMAARKTLDQSARKLMYKECLDIVIDWAVEVPVYQRQNAIAFSAERVNMATVTPDITTFYGWMAEIQNLEMK